MPIFQLKCHKCGDTFFSAYVDYYSCAAHWYEPHNAVTCPHCYQAGHTQCPECAQPMTFNDGKRNAKWASDNGIMFGAVLDN